MLINKKVLFIIGGGISAYKSLEIIRLLQKKSIEVVPVLTKSASEFVTSLSVAALSKKKVHQSLFDLHGESEIGHIQLSRAADIVLVAPATANLMSKIDNKKILYDKNNVKVVVKKNLDALYFSRETIPYIENLNENYIFYLQSGIIAFRASALLDFNKIKETYLEKAESVDMNRLLENNINIRMVLSKGLTLGIDTKKEMIFAAKILRNDTYIKKYI